MKSLKFALLFFLVISSFKAFANELRPFETDLCTFSPDGTLNQPELWSHCCIMHDVKYWFGGGEKDIDKADLDLKSCVEKVAGEKWGQIIYRGVRLGHLSPIRHRLHWSWGWVTPREKTPLTDSEKKYVLQKIRSLKIEKSYIDQVIEEYFL